MRPCALCGASLRPRHIAARDPETGASFSVFTCPSCELDHTQPVPPNLGDYYAQQYHGGRHGVTAALCLRRRYRWLERHTQGRGRLVDLGCGDGSFLRHCRARGWRVAGTERAGAVSEAARRDLDIREELAQLADFGPFTAATAWHSLEHLEEPMPALRALREQMTPGGTLLVAVPNARSLQARAFGRRWFHLDVPRHLCHFSDRALSRALEGAGFRVVARHHGELEYDLFGWVQSGLDLVLPTPRVLFHRLTGKPTVASPATTAASFAAALGLAVPAAALTLLERQTRRSGTLVLVARVAAGK